MVIKACWRRPSGGKRVFEVMRPVQMLSKALTVTHWELEILESFLRRQKHGG
jgi:hypothetical protein